jgi:hypothetical protein
MIKDKKHLKTIGFVGSNNSLMLCSIAAIIAQAKNPAIPLVVNPIDMSNVIQLNGKYYKKKKPVRSNFVLAMYTGSNDKERPKVNIVSEFDLIQKKKSRLSKSERNWVEDEFYRNFSEIDKVRL